MCWRLCGVGAAESHTLVRCGGSLPRGSTDTTITPTLLPVTHARAAPTSRLNTDPAPCKHTYTPEKPHTPSTHYLCEGKITAAHNYLRASSG